jgi:lysozyme
MLTPSKKCEDLIKRFEGKVLTAYKCSADKWTIGWGHTSGVKKGMVISNDQAEEFFQQDLLHHWLIVKKNITVELTQGQVDALTSFVFNVGPGEFIGKSVMTYTNDKRFKEVPARLKLYKWSGGKITQGLINRRAAECAMWMS